jgi:hypothetical protein
MSEQTTTLIEAAKRLQHRASKDGKWEASESDLYDAVDDGKLLADAYLSQQADPPKDAKPCNAIGTHHGDPCNGGRIQSPNAQFTQDCPACNGTGLTTTVTNAAGGKQSKVTTRFDLMPPAALIRIAEVLAKGSHYGKDNWRLIPKGDHINHAMRHLAMYLKGDASEDHLGNACCRMMFAIEAPEQIG